MVYWIDQLSKLWYRENNLPLAFKHKQFHKTMLYIQRRELPWTVHLSGKTYICLRV